MEIDDLRDQIRKVRDTFGDDKCWKDWHKLFAMLPEGYVSVEQDTQVELKQCEIYLKCMAEGTEYIPPARWIIGEPDRVGLWYVIDESQNHFMLMYCKGDHIKQHRIAKSYGPIPKGN